MIKIKRSLIEYLRINGTKDISDIEGQMISVSEDSKFLMSIGIRISGIPQMWNTGPIERDFRKWPAIGGIREDTMEYIYGHVHHLRPPQEIGPSDQAPNTANVLDKFDFYKTKERKFGVEINVSTALAERFPNENFPKGYFATYAVATYRLGCYEYSVWRFL